MACAISLLTACVDDNDGNQRYNDGYLHFNLQFNGDQQSRWAEDGTGSHTRALASTPMTAEGMEGLTLYLHCEEKDCFDQHVALDNGQPATRGKRIEHEAFADDALQSFGIYGKVGSTVVLPYSTKFVKSSLTLGDDSWYEETIDLNFGTDPEAYWPDDAVGSFYGYAPYPGDGTDEAKCISVADNGSGVPTLTCTMQHDEADNKDILTASKKNLTRDEKNNGIELLFRHVLTAVKFKGTTIEGFRATVSGETKEFTLKVKKIRVSGIYNTGTCAIGETPTTWDLGSTTDYCDVSDINQTEVDINDDEHCLLLLPQATPPGAKLTLDCQVLDGETVVKEDPNISASLEDKTWEPGYSYTYTLSDTPMTRTLSISPATIGEFELDGSEKEITVMSYYSDGSGADYVPADWHIEYKDEENIWHNGLPEGYVLLDENKVPVLDEHMENVPSKITGTPVGGKKYYLRALMRSEKSEIIPMLQVNQYGTKGNPRDLSLYDVTGAPLRKGRCTANSYMINGYGYFKIPLVYGNAIKNGQTNAWSYTERGGDPIFVNYLDNHIEKPYIIDDVKDDAGSLVSSISDVEPFVIWQDEPNLVLPSSLSITEKDGLGFMEFSIAKPYVKPGNAIIGIRETAGDKRILWSWHIWVSARHMEETVEVSNAKYRLDFAQYNLGWRVPETKTYDDKTTTITIKQDGSAKALDISATQKGGTITISGSNLYYQHGRKDPMPAAYLENGNQKDMALSIYKLGYCQDWWKLYPAGRTEETATNATIISPTKLPTMGYAIQHPYWLYAAQDGDWMAAGKNNWEKAGRWDPERAGNYSENDISSSAAFTDRISTSPSAYSHIKTVYDPCPVGFAVPPCSAYELLFDWTTSTETGNDEGLNYVKFNGPTGSLTFRKTGWRVHDAPGDVKDLNRLGYYWTAGVRSDNVHEGWYLRINLYNTYEAFTYCRNHTEPIRPVVDNEDERIKVIDSTYETSDYPKHDGEVDPGNSLSRRR